MLLLAAALALVQDLVQQLQRDILAAHFALRFRLSWLRRWCRRRVHLTVQPTLPVHVELAGGDRPDRIGCEVAVGEILLHQRDRPRIAILVRERAQMLQETRIGGAGAGRFVDQAAQLLGQGLHLVVPALPGAVARLVLGPDSEGERGDQ